MPMRKKLLRITIQGYKTIRDQTLDLSDINILIGANGAGKSNLLSFFELLAAMAEGRLQHHVGIAGGANDLLYYGAKNTPGITTHLEIDSEERFDTYSPGLRFSPPDTFALTKEDVSFIIKDAPTTGSIGRRFDYRELEKRGKAIPSESPLLYRDDVSKVMFEGFRDTSDKTAEKTTFGFEEEFPDAREKIEKTISLFQERYDGRAIPDNIFGFLKTFRRYQINDTSISAPIRGPQNIDDNLRLRPDGGNLAAFLYMLKTTKPFYYNRITETLRRVLPFFQDFQLEPRRLNPNQILLQWYEKHSDHLFGTKHLSDGSLRLMVLMTLLLQPDEDMPALMIIDEPELGLHPHAMEIVASAIGFASDHSQILISTQSPDFINFFEPEEIIVVERPKNETILRRLDANKLKKWLEDYSLSELWEKNILGGEEVSAPSGQAG